MSLFGTKEISVAEYTNVSITTPRLRPSLVTTVHTPLQFNGLKLCYAIAITRIKKILSIPELWFDSISSWMGLSHLVDSGVPFKFREERVTRLKDFIRTSKIGEVAQGIAYLHAQEKLGYKTIVDFEQFFLDRNILLPKGISTPDFILQNNISTQIAMLESKGTEINSTTSIKSILNTGLSQCISGSSFATQKGFVVTNKYVLCSEFSTDTIPEDSVLHFVDPADNQSISNFDDSIFKHHFASWFYLLGDFENVNRLLKLENIDFNNEYFILRQIRGENYYVITNRNIFRNFSERLLSKITEINMYITFSEFMFQVTERGKFFIGISSKIVDHLQGVQILTEFPNFEISSEGETVFLADGIILGFGNI